MNRSFVCKYARHSLLCPPLLPLRQSQPWVVLPQYWDPFCVPPERPSVESRRVEVAKVRCMERVKRKFPNFRSRFGQSVSLSEDLHPYSTFQQAKSYAASYRTSDDSLRAHTRYLGITSIPQAKFRLRKKDEHVESHSRLTAN